VRKQRPTTVHGVRGRSVEVPATPTAPIITAIDASTFSILWLGPNPFEWAIQVQGEEGGEWDFDHAIPGTARTSDDVGNPYAVRIVGRNEGHDPVTDVSNILILNL
jgi:hypothetical protein